MFTMPIAMIAIDGRGGGGGERTRKEIKYDFKKWMRNKLLVKNDRKVKIERKKRMKTEERKKKRESKKKKRKKEKWRDKKSNSKGER